MPQSLTQIYIHIIFGTKYRDAIIDPNIKDQLYNYLIDKLKYLDTSTLSIGGTEDHVHILCRQSKNYSASKIVEKIKTKSSHWLKSKGILNFYWQGGYSAFSVSPSNLEVVKKYINSQEEHHKKVSFQDEFEYLLKKYNQ